MIGGLDWLHLSNTVGLSHNEVRALIEPGGSLASYRFATMSEVEILFTTIHPGWVEGSTTSNFGLANELAALLGETWSNQTGTQIEVHGATGDSGGGACCAAAFQVVRGFRGMPTNIDQVTREIVNRNRTTNRFGRPYAAYLVRGSVPEPAPLLLVATTLICLASARRRRRTRT